MATVEPKGNYLGLARGLPNPEDPLGHWMVVCGAGQAAEELFGIEEHGGCGSDLYHQRRLAEFRSIDLYGGRVSPESLVSDRISVARSWISQTGEGSILNMALCLACKGTIHY